MSIHRNYMKKSKRYNLKTPFVFPQRKKVIEVGTVFYHLPPAVDYIMTFLCILEDQVDTKVYRITKAGGTAVCWSWVNLSFYNSRVSAGPFVCCLCSGSLTDTSQSLKQNTWINTPSFNEDLWWLRRRPGWIWDRGGVGHLFLLL